MVRVTDSNERYRNGREKLRAIFGEAGESVMRRVAETSPDMARCVYEFGYADIYSRPGLDLRARSIATVAALTALGHSPIELKAHLHGALNVGVTRQEILVVDQSIKGRQVILQPVDALLVPDGAKSEKSEFTSGCDLHLSQRFAQFSLSCFDLIRQPIGFLEI